MQLILFSVLLVCLFFGVSIGFRIWLRRCSVSPFTQEMFDAGVCAFLIGAIMLGLVGCNIFFSQPNLTLYIGSVAGLFGVVCATALWPVHKKVWMPILCGLSVFLIYSVFPELTVNWWHYALMGIVWTTVMAMVVYFDRLPLVSFMMMAMFM